MMKGTDAFSSDTIASLLSRWARSVVAGSSVPNSCLLLSVNGGEQFRLWLSPISDDSDMTFDDLVFTLYLTYFSW